MCTNSRKPQAASCKENEVEAMRGDRLKIHDCEIGAWSMRLEPQGFELAACSLNPGA